MKPLLLLGSQCINSQHLPKELTVQVLAAHSAAGPSQHLNLPYLYTFPDVFAHCTPAAVPQVIQLYETTIVRHGLMLVGPTMGGKTCCYRSLQKAMTKLNAAGNEKWVDS